MRKSFGGLLFIARAAHDVAAGTSKCIDLLQRAFDVGRLGGRHRLDRDGCAATNGNIANVQLTSYASLVSGLREELAHDDEVRATARVSRGPRHRDTAWTRRAQP